MDELKQILAETKMLYAVSQAENEEAQHTNRRLARGGAGQRDERSGNSGGGG